MQSSSRDGYPRYQGYPYVNPVVHDVPSISPETASRWANLPRRPLQDGPSVGSGGSRSEGGQDTPTIQRNPGYQGYPYVNPVYTDVSASRSPETSGGGSDANNSQYFPESLPVHLRVPRQEDQGQTKKDIDDNPVVYIDLPEAGSEVSMISTPASEAPEFVQNTILFDQFENRRIGIPKEEPSFEGSMDSMFSSQQVLQTRVATARPPNSLDLHGASGSRPVTTGSPSRQTPGVPSFMSKESQVYGGTDGADGFPVSPIPISEFPEPPPAYSEVDERRPAREESRGDTPAAVDTPQPPRTQVIVNGSAGTINHIPVRGRTIDQKNLTCHHCGATVDTIVHKEVGAITHLIAFFASLLMGPLAVVVYLTDYFKYKNHYCPNCFKLIGYQTPLSDQKVRLVMSHVEVRN